jgi:hypothetical protein
MVSVTVRAITRYVDVSAGGNAPPHRRRWPNPLRALQLAGSARLRRGPGKTGKPDSVGGAVPARGRDVARGLHGWFPGLDSDDVLAVLEAPRRRGAPAFLGDRRATSLALVDEGVAELEAHPQVAQQGLQATACTSGSETEPVSLDDR